MLSNLDIILEKLRNREVEVPEDVSLSDLKGFFLGYERCNNDVIEVIKNNNIKAVTYPDCVRAVRRSKFSSYYKSEIIDIIPVDVSSEIYEAIIEVLEDKHISACYTEDIIKNIVKKTEKGR